MRQMALTGTSRRSVSIPLRFSQRSVRDTEQNQVLVSLLANSRGSFYLTHVDQRS
jgi:hypothetical protein